MILLEHATGLQVSVRKAEKQIRQGKCLFTYRYAGKLMSVLNRILEL